MKGRFITIEGVEGCGKSTQVVRLKHELEDSGYEVEVTREPGGTAIGEQVRQLLLDPAHGDISPMAELLLYEAARAQHVDQRIRPALEAGKIVVCDRFADSTSAYQGAGRGFDMTELEELHRTATRGTWPDLTVVIDVPVEMGLERAAHVHAPDRLEQESLDFHRRVRDGFLALARNNPERIKVVDGNREVQAIAEDILGLARTVLEHP